MPGREFYVFETQMNQLRKGADLTDNKFKTMQLINFFSQSFQNETDAPVFLAGDFDEEPTSIPISRVMERGGFVDCFSLKNLQINQSKEERQANDTYLIELQAKIPKHLPEKICLFSPGLATEPSEKYPLQTVAILNK